jgi:hypothetical protein
LESPNNSRNLGARTLDRVGSLPPGGTQFVFVAQSQNPDNLATPAQVIEGSSGSGISIADIEHVDSLYDKVRRWVESKK